MKQPGFVKRGEPLRLQTFLARSGVASRRAAEEMVDHGRVRVNGKTVTVQGMRITAGVDKVDVDGVEVKVAPTTWVALHKPTGYVTTRTDPYDRRTVYDLLPEKYHGLFHVGRLDRDSEGLLLLTNDGDLANRFLHPRYGITKEYDVIATGKPSDATLRQLVEGVELDDGSMATAESARLIGPAGNGLSRLKLVLKEGKKREVRRMLEVVGHPVKRLVRRRFGPIELGELPEGKWRVLALEELSHVRDEPAQPRVRPDAEPRKVKSSGSRTEVVESRPKRAAASADRKSTHGAYSDTTRKRTASGPEKRPSRAAAADGERRPSRAVGGERPSRAVDADRPARSAGAERPSRPLDAEKRPRSVDADSRPAREKRPARPMDADKRPARSLDDKRPSRSADGEKRPARALAEGEKRPRRAPADGETRTSGGGEGTPKRGAAKGPIKQRRGPGTEDRSPRIPAPPKRVPRRPDVEWGDLAEWDRPEPPRRDSFEEERPAPRGAGPRGRDDRGAKPGRGPAGDASRPRGDDRPSAPPRVGPSGPGRSRKAGDGERFAPSRGGPRSGPAGGQDSSDERPSWPPVRGRPAGRDDTGDRGPRPPARGGFRPDAGDDRPRTPRPPVVEERDELDDFGTRPRRSSGAARGGKRIGLLDDRDRPSRSSGPSRGGPRPGGSDGDDRPRGGRPSGPPRDGGGKPSGPRPGGRPGGKPSGGRPGGKPGGRPPRGR
ncbi:pseudouridine synthase [Longimicrobium terrae]|uniref:Pseudouridine synthase n=1 Tax=Longimicrobium terrae TaxID=1639882 RepID=A0A841GVM9_9BACT|nr:pseudouridine synthase [Longimicrobium terrae]MBB4635140.1 23S rRNA pseudouridine2605 synthase [Longimicrobium terrae]MBB6069534.1 23S rRNA pseudouridine2605 synthase [Longimicrobium terrae]NNC31664.1 pseudouridine synthase [Longimicrobium terrae]